MPVAIVLVVADGPCGRRARPLRGDARANRRVSRSPTPGTDCACTGCGVSSSPASGAALAALGLLALRFYGGPALWPLAFLTLYVLVLLAISTGSSCGRSRSPSRTAALGAVARDAAPRSGSPPRTTLVLGLALLLRQPRRHSSCRHAVPDAHRRVHVPRDRALSPATRGGGACLMATISYEHVTKRFDDTVAVDDLSSTSPTASSSSSWGRRAAGRRLRCGCSPDSRT